MEMNPREAFTQKLLEDYLTPEAVPQVQITPFPDEEEEITEVTVPADENIDVPAVDEEN